ncbi:MAG: hypothetical protein HFG20_10910 [Anaerotruncus sp.]|nr:hypothetical protein [Anaerotruncus sp.]
MSEFDHVFQKQDELAEYFSSLPPMVQTTIKQCGVKFSSRQELEQYAAHLMQK